ncbi:hypothetical protein ACLOJK_017202 [Asimina triloba]
MASVLSINLHNWPSQALQNPFRSRFEKVHQLGYSSLDFPSGRRVFVHGESPAGSNRSGLHSRPVYFKAVMSDSSDPLDGGNGDQDKESTHGEGEGVVNDSFRQELEKIVGMDDSAFTGLDLATLIRNKYGRSYDVQLIKKEFMGRNLLAMNVMWKYMEQAGNILQRSFPLTEEEYLLRLDDIANTLKCWGAVSHIRNSLAKLKERPRIGKAVSIFIDMDETGGRSKEWIYK